MNNNKNNILNKLPKKQHTVFLIVIIILILTFVIFIIRNHLKHDEYKQRFVKNVFFVEMDDPTKTPFDASRGNSDKYELDRTICVRGKSRDKYISNRALHIKLPYSMTFWFNINSDLVGQYLNNKNNSRTKYPLVYFSDNQYKKNKSGTKSGTTNNQNLLPGINMNIINNELVCINGNNYQRNSLSGSIKKYTDTSSLKKLTSLLPLPLGVNNIPIEVEVGVPKAEVEDEIKPSLILLLSVPLSLSLVLLLM